VAFEAFVRGRNPHAILTRSKTDPEAYYIPTTQSGWIGWLARSRTPREAIPMILYCPRCHHQHIDKPSGVWSNPPHRSHLCSACGWIWRPADVATTGVKNIQTRGEHDS